MPFSRRNQHEMQSLKISNDPSFSVCHQNDNQLLKIALRSRALLKADTKIKVPTHKNECGNSAERFNK